MNCWLLCYHSIHLPKFNFNNEMSATHAGANWFVKINWDWRQPRSAANNEKKNKWMEWIVFIELIASDSCWPRGRYVNCFRSLHSLQSITLRLRDGFIHNSMHSFIQREWMKKAMNYGMKVSAVIASNIIII